MGLRLTLKPFERLIINGAAIRNGDRPVSFL
ncbi:flagellar biosynthesis repressor FlbT, partial [Methylobacterium sp. J-048]